MIIATTEQEAQDSHIPDALVAPKLEEWTGADLMVSPVHIPLTEATLPEHIRSGACLVQVKRGHDLASSVLDGRLHKSIDRMRQTGARNCQRVLLFVGILQHSEDGEALINTHKVAIRGKSYWSIQTAIDEWTEGGGVYMPLSKMSLVGTWLRKKEERLIEYMDHPKREIIIKQRLYAVNEDDPLQEISEVTDFRKTLITIPGMGEKKIRNLIATMRNTDAQVSLLNCLTWLTDWDLCQRVPLCGEGTWRETRNWLGLGDEMDLYALPKVAVDRIGRDITQDVIQ